MVIPIWCCHSLAFCRGFFLNTFMHCMWEIDSESHMQKAHIQRRHQALVICEEIGRSGSSTFCQISSSVPTKTQHMVSLQKKINTTSQLLPKLAPSVQICALVYISTNLCLFFTLFKPLEIGQKCLRVRLFHLTETA